MNKNVNEMPSHPLEALPDCLGLGILDSNSVEINPDELVADYKIEGEVIYRVSISEKNFQIVELLDGLVIATTSEHVSLQETFFHHLVSQPPYQSKRFEWLFHRLADNRNINVRFALKSQFLYYPSGYIFSLRQPIVNSNKTILNRLNNPLVDVSDQANPKLSTIREGVILRLQQTGEVAVEHIQVADFSTPLDQLVNSVDLIWQSGLVPKEKEYQLTVLDSSMASAGNVSIYLGDIERGFVTFSVIVTEGTDLDLEQVQNNFRNSSFQLLENLKDKK
jgi:hypothetical protein